MKQWLKTHIFSISIILIMFSIAVSSQRELNAEKRYNSSLKTEIYNYKLKDGTLVSSSTVKTVSEKEIKEVIKKSSPKVKLLARQFHKVKEINSSHQVVAIDTIKVPFTDTISKTKIGEKSGIGYSFNYKVTPQDLSIYNLKIPDSITRIKGVKRKWFLGKETYVIDEIHSNPNIVIEGSNTFEIQTEKHWYTSKLFLFSAGFITAAYILK